RAADRLVEDLLCRPIAPHPDSHASHENQQREEAEKILRPALHGDSLLLRGEGKAVGHKRHKSHKRKTSPPVGSAPSASFLRPLCLLWLSSSRPRPPTGGRGNIRAMSEK